MSGRVLRWKFAQWPQVIEAYSTMVIGASALPSTLSGSEPSASTLAISTLPLGCGTLAAVELVVGCALALPPESLHAASRDAADTAASEPRTVLRERIGVILQLLAGTIEDVQENITCSRRRS